MKVIFEEYGLLILGALAVVVLVACIFFFENPVKDAVQGLISQFSNNVHIPSFGSYTAVRPRNHYYFVAFDLNIERMME